jgi:hypothetical protein
MTFPSLRLWVRCVVDLVPIPTQCIAKFFNKEIYSFIQKSSNHFPLPKTFSTSTQLSESCPAVQDVALPCLRHWVRCVVGCANQFTQSIAKFFAKKSLNFCFVKKVSIILNTIFFLRHLVG